MGKFRRYFYILITISLALNVFGQVDPANWKTSVNKTELKAGEVIELIFKTDIPEGSHIYSNDYGDCPPVKAVFIFEKNSSYELVGGAVPIGSHKYIDEIFECEVADFENKAEFRQKVKILSAKPKIKGVLEYQLCTADGRCVQFEYDFNVKGLKVSGSSQTPSETNSPDKTNADPSKSGDSEAPQSASKMDSIILAKLETCCNDDKKVSSAAGVVPASQVDYSSYQKKNESDTSSCQEKLFNGEKEEGDNQSYWVFFLVAFISGLAALLTPCVFPMIPMTVSYFLKEKNKAKAIRSGLIYGLSIIGIYVIIGTLVAVVAGPAAANFLSTHWLPNIFFFLIFVIFAASFFGAFEITLPSWLVNKADQQADRGGFIGVFFMAFTIVLVSFSCTGPIVGSILVESAGGQFVKPLIGMLGFSLAFAIPFALFAIFPSWINGLPQSGGWLNSVKVVLGFIELAFGLKFLSVADQTYHWGLLDREIYIALWVVIFTLMGIYLLGKLKFSHDSDLPYLKVPRLFMGILTFTFVIYLIPGLWGAPLKALAGYMPPMSTHDFDLIGLIKNPDGEESLDTSKPARYSDKLHLPYGIKGYFDYEEGMEAARQLGMPVFIDFTGHGCVNCREMEARVWGEKPVLSQLKEDYVVISLYVDDKTINLPKNEWFYSKSSGSQITTLAKKNAAIQWCYFNENSQPQYILMDNRGELLQHPKTRDLDVDAFAKWLQKGKEIYDLRIAEELRK